LIKLNIQRLLSAEPWLELRRVAGQLGWPCLHRARDNHVIIAGLRLAKTAKEIETDTEVLSTGARFDLALAVLIGLLGASLLLYMSQAVLRTL
jgi:hypothetical protein